MRVWIWNLKWQKFERCLYFTSAEKCNHSVLRLPKGIKRKTERFSAHNVQHYNFKKQNKTNKKTATDLEERWKCKLIPLAFRAKMGRKFAVVIIAMVMIVCSFSSAEFLVFYTKGRHSTRVQSTVLYLGSSKKNELRRLSICWKFFSYQMKDITMNGKDWQHCTSWQFRCAFLFASLDFLHLNSG